jgi:shikimate dehydrogenase
MLVGLIGANIQGSMSPALFADAFVAAGIDGYYHLLDVDQLPGRSLRQILDAARTSGFAGVNVTYPFKQDIIPLLDAVDPNAAQVGAVNTVAIAADGATMGYNFDRLGWRNSFSECFGPARGRDAAVVQIGAGGAGRAVVYALMDLGVSYVIHDLDAARASALVDDVTSHFGASRCRVAGDIGCAIRAADGVVNATQVGMTGFPGNPVPSAALHSGQWAAERHLYPAADRIFEGGGGEGGKRAEWQRDVRASSCRSLTTLYGREA